MNIERSLARAIKWLGRLTSLSLFLFLLKIIQSFPSITEREFLDKDLRHWMLSAKATCTSSDCWATAIWESSKTIFSVWSPFAEWVLISTITLCLLDGLIDILRGLLDDEGLFIDV